ncbi:MAG TPA: VanZ family protein [Gaiellaceae bacterium]|jgi:VanZ family protein
MSRIPRTLSLWLPVVAWAALIFALSSIPSLNSGLGVWDLVLRKLAHAAEYAVLAALLLRALTSPWLAFLVAVTYAASDEFHQHFVRGRAGRPRDVAIDAVGALIGVAVFSYRRRRTVEHGDSKTS